MPLSFETAVMLNCGMFARTWLRSTMSEATKCGYTGSDELPATGGGQLVIGDHATSRSAHMTHRHRDSRGLRKQKEEAIRACEAVDGGMVGIVTFRQAIVNKIAFEERRRGNERVDDKAQLRVPTRRDANTTTATAAAAVRTSRARRRRRFTASITDHTQ